MSLSAVRTQPFHICRFAEIFIEVQWSGADEDLAVAEDSGNSRKSLLQYSVTVAKAILGPFRMQS
jgi:hypothetical protein